MAIRHPLRLVKLYKRALRGRRTALSAQLEDRSLPIPARCGSFSQDLTHYQSHFMPRFQSGTLYGLDRFSRQPNRVPDFYYDHLPVHIVGSPEQSLAHLSSARSWETVQSVSYHALHVETLCRTSPTVFASTQPATPTRPLSQIKGSHVEASAGASSSASQEQPKLSKEAKLAFVAKGLADTLPNFFVRIHNYGLYSRDVVFENRIRDVTTTGLNNYSAQLTKYKTMAHLLYSHVNVDVLKITEHPEDGSVRVRWRINAIGGLKPYVMFWKLFTRAGRRQFLETIDGFSVFYVGEDGLIYKHVADKMIPDDDKPVVEDVKVKLAKLAGVMGFILPGTAAGGLTGATEQHDTL